MAGEAEKPAEVYTPRRPKVNKRTVNLNGGREISFGNHQHNPSGDSIRVDGFERSIREYSEIGASFLKEE